MAGIFSTLIIFSFLIWHTIERHERHVKDGEPFWVWGAGGIDRYREYVLKKEPTYKAE